MKRLWKTALLLAASLVGGFGQSASNIDPDHASSWSPNLGWMNWRAHSAQGAVIGEFVCSGFIYSANAGWIHLGDGLPVNGVKYSNQTAEDFGVNHDGLGRLEGLAYGANIGWIAFETNGAPRVDLLSGRLSGYAYSANTGWMDLGQSNFFLKIDFLDPGADADADGIPDSWELIHAPTLAVLTREGDRDGDGQLDSGEFLADTNPLDAKEALRITGIRVSSDRSSASLTWTVKPTRQYRILTRSALGESNPWSPALSAIQGGQGVLHTQSLPLPANPQTLFFEIEALRPLAR